MPLIEEPQPFLWPADFPEGCPPEDAEPRQTTAYRFVKYDPPQVSDFARPIELPRKTPPEPERLCDYHALSIFREATDISLAREFIPGFRKKLVAKGTISVADGVLKADPAQVGASPVLESHHNWWVPVEVDPGASFEVVDA